MLYMGGSVYDRLPRKVAGYDTYHFRVEFYTDPQTKHFFWVP